MCDILLPLELALLEFAVSAIRRQLREVGASIRGNGKTGRVNQKLIEQVSRWDKGLSQEIERTY